MMKEKMNKGLIRTYLAYKNVFTNRKGSPTVEYVIVIGAAALMAGLLMTALNESSGLSQVIKQKIEQAIKGK